MVEIELFPLFSLNKPSRLEKMDMGQSIIDTFSVLKDKVSGGYVSAIERYFQSLLGEGNTCKQFFPIHPSFASVRCAQLALATAPFTATMKSHLVFGKMEGWETRDNSRKYSEEEY